MGVYGASRTYAARYKRKAFFNGNQTAGQDLFQDGTKPTTQSTNKYLFSLVQEQEPYTKQH